jgi:hypothetical protein
VTKQPSVEFFLIACICSYACDMKVVRLMRSRGLGNSVTQLSKKLMEQHREKWLERGVQYMTACGSFSALKPIASFAPLPPQASLPSPRLLMSVYVRDVLSRIDDIKAKLTSTVGSILKMDSSKKITRKLAGTAAGTAQWATDVGNEYGQILACVLTTAEGSGIRQMARGLVGRYATAGIPPPAVMYVDRDCCSVAVKNLFKPWKNLIVRLDIWHLMRRLARGVKTESHQLYGVFMSKLSSCIFEWDAVDFDELCAAKAAECGLTPSEAAHRLSRRELALHCRRRTRGVDETIRLISRLIVSLSGDAGRDTLGMELFDADVMKQIWKEEQKHIPCIQDPDPNVVQLYTVTGSLVKGGKRLNTYRCGRGSVSLESFHYHLARFIPGNQQYFFFN